MHLHLFRCNNSALDVDVLCLFECILRLFRCICDDSNAFALIPVQSFCSTSGIAIMHPFRHICTYFGSIHHAPFWVSIFRGYLSTFLHSFQCINSAPIQTISILHLFRRISSPASVIDIMCLFERILHLFRCILTPISVYSICTHFGASIVLVLVHLFFVKVL